MSFSVGDRVVCIEPPVHHPDVMVHGQLFTVAGFDPYSDVLVTDGRGRTSGGWLARRFKLAPERKPVPVSHVVLKLAKTAYRVLASLRLRRRAA